MVVYLVQHTQADEEKGRIYGHTDSLLSDAGRQQAVKLGQTWTERKMKAPVKIYSSDLQRASETAAIIRESFGFPADDAVPVECVEALRELKFGNWDGKTWAEIYAVDKEKPKILAWSKDWCKNAPTGGETFKEFVWTHGTQSPQLTEFRPVL